MNENKKVFCIYKNNNYDERYLWVCFTKYEYAYDWILKSKFYYKYEIIEEYENENNFEFISF